MTPITAVSASTVNQSFLTKIKTFCPTDRKIMEVVGHSFMALAAFSMAFSLWAAVSAPTWSIAITLLTAGSLFSFLGDYILRSSVWVCSTQPTGISNHYKNNCWINAIMQGIILQCPQLRNWLLYNCPDRLAPFRNFITQYLRDQTWKEWVTSADSSNLRDCLRAISPQISELDSEDANEGLMHIMNQLPANSPLIHNLINFRYYSLDGFADPIDNVLTVQQEDDGRRIAYSTMNTPNWGNIRLDLEQSNTPPPFMNLVNTFFDNALGGQAARYNTAAGVRQAYPVIGERALFNTGNRPSAPPFLIFNLTRFNYDLTKNTTPVYPPAHFDLPGQYTNSQTNTLYELESKVIHYGTLDRGHYISYVKRQGRWFRCDDSKITLVSEQEVMCEDQVYLCYYRKIT